MSTIVRSEKAHSPLRAGVSRLARLVTTPLLPTDYVDVIDPLRSSNDLRGRIVAVTPETADAVTLTIKPGRTWRAHTPGQYLRIGVDIDGVRQWRAYSLTSPLDRRDGCVTITVKAMPDGVVSNYLVRRARVGMIVQLDHASGDFVLPTQPPSKVLFLTAGSGITPVMGMLRNHASALTDVVVIHSAPTAADVIFDAELRKLAQSNGFRLVVRHTDDEGMLATEELAELVLDLAERETWACGPLGLLDALEAHWAELAISDQLHTERFRPALAAVGEGGSVTFTRAGVAVEADGATPILTAGEAAGVMMPSGCRMGICFGCVVPLRQGAVRDLRNGDLTTASVGDGVLVQTCINAPAGACEIDV